MTKYKIYLRICKKRSIPILFGIILLAISTVIAVRIPFLMNKAMDTLFKVTEGYFKEFIILFACYIGLYYCQITIDFVTTILFKKIGNKNAAELANEIVHKTINCEKKVPSQIKVGDSVIVLTADVFQLGEAGILLLYKILYLLINVGALFYYMWQTNSILCILITCIFISLMIIQKKINNHVGSIIIQGKELSSNYYSITNNIVEKHEEHKRNGGTNYVLNIFKKNISELLNQRLKLSKATSLIQLITGCAIIINIATIFLLGSFYVANGSISLSELITFNMFANTFGNYLIQLPNVFVGKKEFDISCKRVNKMLEIQVYSDYNNSEINIDNIYDIKLNNINFKFDEKNQSIIQNFTTEFRKGNIYCIEGTNGSGKSTLMGIINGDYQIKQGKILINNKEIDMHLAKNWTENFLASFSAESILYNDNILNNIILDRQENFNKVMEMCKVVNLYDWIESLDDGIHTKINELKENLSDGQKQKITLARFLLAQKKVILMDEMEKHLDNDTKKNILGYLKSIKKNYIIILISHDIFIKSQSDVVISLNTI